MTEVTDTARKANDSDAVHWGAKLGFAARATIYLLMGLLALSLAFGNSSSETDQRGALQSVAEKSGGKVLLVALALGFAGYALWRLGEAAFGVTGEGKDKGPRVKALVSGLVYGSLAVTTVTLLLGSSSGSQAQQQSSLTARVMEHTGGRWLVGLVGLVIAGAGAVMVYEGLKKKFMKYLRTGEMSPSERTVVGRLGMVGTIARGVVIGLSGVLVVQAAVTFDPDKARGLDGALRTLASQPFGPYLLGAAALGLVAFGVYGYAEARWRRT
jgi:hypothetical protein